MHLPKALARFNRHVTNPIQRLWAGVLPGFGIIEHVGRRSGRGYRTPLNVFRAPGGFVVLLDYGPDTDWVRNLTAASGGRLVYRRKHYVLTAPRIVSGDAGRRLLPAPIRLVSRIARVDNVLRLDASAA
jgi:deazaflavin-dependent oxidoreductase (nitroreductase family)